MAGLKLTKQDDISGVDPHLLPQLAPGHIKDTIRHIQFHVYPLSTARRKIGKKGRKKMFMNL